ncbi:MAG: Pyrrolo-quinoline quinone, partial [Phycisphaerales bacterium]|nr:Pyrrolo-quinoline quinone [Phycisphaerales bacterium]
MKINLNRCLLWASTLALSISFNTGRALANDWYQWRGPEQNGVCRETNLPEKWSPEGENLVWSAPVGGMSSPIVMKGKFYTLTRVGEIPADNGTAVVPGPKTQEAVVCLDAKTGKPLWQHTANMYMTDDPFHRLGWSNCVGDPRTGRVYALGAENELVCLDGETGKEIWKHQMTEEYGLISTFGGRTPSPALDEDRLYVAGVAFGWADNAGGQYRVFSFDKNTGQPLWTNGTGGIPVDAPYQTPVIANINGEHVLVTGSGDGGTYCFQARTGKKLWGFKGAKRGFNASVLVNDNKVYVNWDLDNLDSTRLGRVVCLDPAHLTDGSPKEVWRIDGIEAGFPSSTIADGTLYVADDGAVIYAIDAATGKVKYKKRFGTIGKASLVFADGKLYYPEANGRMWILKPGEKKFEVLSHVDLEEKKGREYTIFGSVAIADGHVYIQAANTTYCIGPKEFAAQNATIPEGPKEEALPDNAKTSAPALVQVVPCDVWLRPGDKVQFVAHAFDAKGRLLGDVKPQWSIGQLTLPAPRARPKELIRPNAAAAAAAAGAPGAPGAPTPGAGASAAPGAAAAAPAPAAAPPVTQPAAPIKAGNLAGEVTPDGVFTATAGPLQGGGVFAADGSTIGFARVRVFPPLPWTLDFEKNLLEKPPLTWIGAGMKFAVRELAVDGNPKNKVLTKLTDIPLYARARTYFGTPDMTDYTIESDVKVMETVYEMDGKVVHKIPDAGVINSRYVLELKGSNQWLSLHGWPA